MYNALCCSIFTPDLDVSGGVPGAKSGTAHAAQIVSPPTPQYSSSFLVVKMSDLFSSFIGVHVSFTVMPCMPSSSYIFLHGLALLDCYQQIFFFPFLFALLPYTSTTCTAV